MAAEAKLEDYLIFRVHVLGGQQRKVKWIARAGGPDRLVWWPKAPAFVELKAPGQKPRKIQENEHERLRTAFDVYVIDNKEDLDALFDKLILKSCLLTTRG